jgi:hypothetical protein
LGNDDARNEAMDAGCIAYLRKPNAKPCSLLTNFFGQDHSSTYQSGDYGSCVGIVSAEHGPAVAIRYNPQAACALLRICFNSARRRSVEQNEGEHIAGL